jgi:uncharacterized protein (DUF433 family)
VAPSEEAIVTDSEKAQDMLAIVRGVHEGAPVIIGTSWAVYDELAVLAAAAEVDAMVTYFQAYKRSARAARLRERLEGFGRTTLESQERRFMAIARSV